MFEYPVQQHVKTPAEPLKWRLLITKDYVMHYFKTDEKGPPPNKSELLTDVSVSSSPGKHMGKLMQFCYFQ